MIPKRPYLLRAMLEWIAENQLTPHILVEAGEGVEVPPAFVKDGRIVLNLSPVAIRNLTVTNDHVMFDGRFGGSPFAVVAPMKSVLAVYSKETGEGMLFDPEYAGGSDEVSGSFEPASGGLQIASVREKTGADGADEPDGNGPRTPPGPKRRNHLTAVK